MSKTPRTDAAVIAIDVVRGAPVTYVTADFARQLESENAELREALSKFAQIDMPEGNGWLELDRTQFLKSHPEFIGYAKSARALLAKVEGK